MMLCFRIAFWVGLGLLCGRSVLACALAAPSGWAMGNYSPAQAGVQAQPVAVRMVSSKDCSAALQVEWQGVTGEVALTGPGPDPLRLLLSLDASGASPLAAAPVDAALFTVQGGRDGVFMFWVRPLENQWVRPGVYSSQLRLRLLGPQGTLDVRDVALSVAVGAAVRAGFSGVGGRVVQFDFGELMQGARRRAVLDVLANTPYQLQLVSARGGKLVNQSFSASEVGYALRVDGVVMSAAAGNAALAVERAGSSRHPLEVEIGPVQKVLAGHYADELLITISAP